MTGWFTASEIAAARLPGLPHSKRRVNRLAERQDWNSRRGADGSALARRRAAKGGGWEFHASLLPKEAQARLDARAARGARAPEAGQGGEAVTASALNRRDARLFLVARADDHLRSNPALTRTLADDAYALTVQPAAEGLPQWVTDIIPSVSGRSLARWRAWRDEGHLHLLAGQHGQRRGGGSIGRLKDGEIAAFIGALIVKQPFLTAQHLRGICAGKYPDLALPDVRSFQRFASEWKADNALVLRKLTDPDGFRSKSRLSGSNMNAGITGLNQLWEIDASPADVMLTNGRHSIYLVIDIWSRRVLILVTKTPRTEATLLLLRKAIIAWGVPETLKTDNGSDFTSRRFVTALNSIGIAHDTTEAFSPEQKGTVERAIGTLQRGLMPLLPGFIGHSVSDRKKIEGRAAFAKRLQEDEGAAFKADLSAPELQAYCDEWAAETYGKHAHSALSGLSPFAKAASFTGVIRQIGNLRALDLLLAPVAGRDGWRTATKQGVRVDDAWFFAPQLMQGATVFCRHDPDDMGHLHLFESETGAFIATAICPERAGLDPVEAISIARAEQAKLVKERARELRRDEARIKSRDMVDWMQKGTRARGASLAAFPQKTAPHGSAGLAAAGEAASGLPPVTAETAPLLASTTNVIALPESPKRRFARALALKAALERSEDISAADAHWLGGYETTAEFRSHERMAGDFGVSEYLRDA